MNKSAGQKTLDALVAWLSGYMSFTDPGMAVVVALWTMHTYITEHLDSTAYLSVQAAGPGCGKTRLLELCSLLSRNAKLIADTTGPTLFKMIGAYDGRITLLFDEAEKYAGSALGVVRSLMNSGQRAGQTVSRSTKDGFVEYPVYCAKAFSLIGDTNPALRSRSLPCHLKKGQPAMQFHWSQARGEAAKLVEMIKVSFARVPTSIEPGHLRDPRDREIWSALYSTAHTIDASDDTKATLDRMSADMAAMKTHAAKKYQELTSSSDPTADKQYGVMALLDLESVCKDGEPFLWSVVAVERMKAIATSPWRTFVDYDGLNETRLAKLLGTFAVKSGTATMHRGKGARLAPKAKGYFTDTIRFCAANYRSEGGQ